MNRFKTAVKWALPYFILFALSICGTYIVFLKGFPYGDDFFYHFGNVLDKYQTVTDGKSLSAISENLAMGLGTGGGLFYSPLPHFTVLLLALMLSPFGGTIFTAFKLTIVLTVFISGIFMYRFGMHLSKNNKIAALVGAGAYILYPYRIYDFLCRSAFAEGYAFLFIPLFIMGLYDIVHMDKEKISFIPFAEIIIGGSLLYLSHNLTALLIFIMGALYLLLSGIRLLPLIKKPKYTLLCAISVTLLIGISSIGMFSQFELMGTDYYNLTDENAMWTSPSHLVNRTDQEAAFSGFLNIRWLRDFMGVNPKSLDDGITMFIVGVVLFFFLDIFLSCFPRLKRYHFIISAPIAFLMIALDSPRIELFVGMAVFMMIYAFAYCIISKSTQNDKRYIIKEPLFWLCIALIIVCIALMEDKTFWAELAPAFLRKIQFPWRMWSVVQICVSILAVLICAQLTKKTVVAICCMLIGLLVVSNQALLEKKLYLENNGWVTELNSEHIFARTDSIGVCKEYCPKILTDWDYVPEYPGSLYYALRNDIMSGSYDKGKYRHQPVVLQGSGSVAVTDCHTPVYEVEIDCDEEILLQFPLIYYPGYVIYLENVSNGEATVLDVQNTDGLVSFNIPAGKYTATTAYEGTDLRKASFVLTPVCSLVTVGALGLELIKRKRKTEQD